MPRGKGEYTKKDYEAAFAKHGNISAVAKSFGVARSTVQQMLGKNRPTLVAEPAATLRKLAVPDKGVAYYIITAAQCNTRINAGFWRNLKAYAAHLGAELMVCPYTYNPKSSLTKVEDAQWDEELVPYLVTDRVQLAPGLVLCAEITRNLPTAARPLSGLESYTGRASSIFPHTKIAMESVASMKNEPAKLMYTTGAVTRHNYSRTKAGYKGEFHHAYGAVIVEVSKQGWWVRHLNADTTNTFYDLDKVVEDGEVYYCDGIEALVAGDVHVAEMGADVMQATWGVENSLMALLKPKTQVLHDVFDMRSRPWQDDKSFTRNYYKHIHKQDSVQEEVNECIWALLKICSMERNTVIVRSNHDLKLEKWLDTADYRTDLVNAEFFLKAQLASVQALKNNEKFNVLEWAIGRSIEEYPVKFLALDESYVLCKSRGGGIECGNHGHLGINGAKGTSLGFTKLARKMIIGDKHSASIHDGVYTVGTCALTQTYAVGPSSWSVTHCLVYPNGKRTLVTMWAGKFWATQGEE